MKPPPHAQRRFRAAVEHLASVDDDLAAIVRAHGVPTVWLRPAGFASLVLFILEQQVSLASASTTYSRILTRIDRMTPEAVLATTADELRIAGVSRQKDRYLRALATAVLDINDHDALVALLEGKFAVLSAAPFQLTVAIASAAAKAGVHYIDLTEDVASTRQVKEIAASADTAFIPQSGLAPGFISIVANDLAQRFDSLDSIRMRVGALPQFPSNSLKYNLTWSTDGVINEYIEPCEAVVNGKLIEVPALEGLEHLNYKN